MKLERKIGKILAQRGLRLATAESCTGGLIAHRITNVPGSSGYFDRGFVVYSNLAKTEMLGIEAALIEKRGAVSREVARAMAEGARKVSGADVAVAVTGIAGPISDDSEKPVGLVYMAVSVVDGPSVAGKHNFKGSRFQIKNQSAEAALALLLETLDSWEPRDLATTP
jgi:PncC family amidohydrolase